MTNLERQQTQTLKRSLIRARERALADARAELARVSDHPYRELAGEVADSADEAVATELADFENAMVQRNLAHVREIDAALQRISGRHYGCCVDCGEPIEYARLDAFPTATRCVTCQTVRERTYRTALRPSL